jgi:hypothetical protein
VTTDEDGTAEPDQTDPTPEAKPLLRTVNPDATPEEIAAVVAVFSALRGEAPAAKQLRNEWGAPHRGVRRSLPHGRGGWRSSGLPG